jgi:ArsR family transcriptional regulator, zinc-responsive transcriptional repressor
MLGNFTDCATPFGALIDVSRGRDILTHMGAPTKTAKLKDLKPVGSVQSFTEAAECLKILAHPVRLRIVQMLLHGRFAVGELAQDCEIPDNVASEHLRLLQRCGFLRSQREGRHVFYEIAEPHLKALMACVESRFLPAPSKTSQNKS